MTESKPTLVIVSTYDALCGLASYTRVLETGLSSHFDVSICAIDAALLRRQDREGQAAAASHISDLCRRVAEADFVNIQFEHGIFGATRQDIMKRFEQVARATKGPLSLTFHTVRRSKSAPIGAFMRLAASLRIGALRNAIEDFRIDRALSKGCYDILRDIQRARGVTAIVHTRDDARYLRQQEQLSRTFDHPLAYFDAQQVRDLTEGTSRADFPELRGLGNKTRILGLFGFVRPYKGFDIAIQALALLPRDYVLALFGGLHPDEASEGRQGGHPFLLELIAMAERLGVRDRLLLRDGLDDLIFSAL